MWLNRDAGEGQKIYFTILGLRLEYNIIQELLIRQQPAYNCQVGLGLDLLPTNVPMPSSLTNQI